ncbi:DNA-methyltransferase [endosymbiont GvMRE of Glomus versiforme]|uniref:DNA-methyltransferase n=1 Tax=endosymbiont GvMRE of Glomus versiforme TaxID=2039283 RepID=UPI000EDEA22E|nr:site-specific DNA-methyltransferase [endosymbiont GvMRE of Glomus versiforme]RHZ36690.1 Methyltransferase [endosymbiont GvMRE of Glomus versiforme]
MFHFQRERERERESNFAHNSVNQGNGLELLRSLPTNSTKLVFFDPQYEIANKVSRIKNWPLIYQTSQQINQFLKEIARVLKPSGFCLLWINKTLPITGQFLTWLKHVSNLKMVDLLMWNKPHFGFGSYFRNQTEFALLLQKYPLNSRLFKDKSFGNVWTENSLSTNQRNHPHQKPKELIKALIEATTEQGDLIIDPCAGSFVVLEACQETNRKFIGCDLTYSEMEEFFRKTKRPSFQASETVCLNCFEFV